MQKYLELSAKLLSVVGFLLVLVLGCTRASLTSVPGNTATPTATFTTIIINTPTNSPTRTFTNVDTSTPTNTMTNTSNGPTNTFTSTVTSTMTSTVTNTQATSTFTNTATSTLTNTITNTATVTATNTITNTATNTATATITNTPGAGGSAFYLYQCGTFAASPDYGSVVTGGTNVPSYNATFTGNPDNLDTACFSGTGDNLDMGIPPSGAILPYVAVMPSTATVNLTGLTTCSFDAWCSGTTGFSFGAGIAAGDTTLNPITLSSTWTTYNITLPVADLSASATMFYVNYTGAAGQNLAIDQIYFH